MTASDEVALLVLDDRELADAIDERRVGREPLAQAVLHLLGDQPPPRVEDLGRPASSPPTIPIAASRPAASPS